jgi:hypothetical protein
MADLFHEKARIYRMIARVERRARVKLTVHAGEMLAIPVMEQVEAGERVDWRRLEVSIVKLINATKKDADRPSHDVNLPVNAIGIIRAFWNQFCNIPPFCRETGRGHERKRKRKR